MVTVAKNFDAPIKMLFPRNIFAWIKNGILTTKGVEFSMLGLGDIAIPGKYIYHIYILSYLKFDIWFLYLVNILIDIIIYIYIFNKY